jgi:hypothetical protein
VSDYHYVFVAPVEPTSENRLAADLGRTLAVDFRERPSTYAAFLAATDGASLDLGTHDYENDRDMPFEDYPYVITVRRIGQSRDSQEACARRVFDQLESTGRYRLMVVDDLQRRVDRLDAPPDGVS